MDKEILDESNWNLENCTSSVAIIDEESFNSKNKKNNGFVKIEIDQNYLLDIPLVNEIPIKKNKYDFNIIDTETFLKLRKEEKEKRRNELKVNIEVKESKKKWEV